MNIYRKREEENKILLKLIAELKAERDELREMIDPLGHYPFTKKEVKE